LVKVLTGAGRYIGVFVILRKRKIVVSSPVPKLNPLLVAEAEDTVSAWPSDTGLPNAIKIIPGNPAHRPRIKVALNPIHRFSINGDSAYIPFGEAPGSFGKPRPRRAGGLLPSKALLRQLHDFIELNRADLFAFDRDPDQGGISGAELMLRLRKLPPKR
jgi:hypothetical protein